MDRPDCRQGRRRRDSFKTNTGKQQKVEGLGGSFSYVRLGEPLFNEYRDLGGRLPTYEDLEEPIALQ